MPTVHPDQMKQFMNKIMEWTTNCNELEVQSRDATGDVAEAYNVIKRDYLWKLQTEIGKLYYYVCGSNDMKPSNIN